METIYHLTPRANWQRALEEGRYTAESLESEGFIHCSTDLQVVRSANRYYHGVEDLLILCIQPDRVAAEIRHENTSGGQENFPHIYGPLNLDAVVNVVAFEPDNHGNFDHHTGADGRVQL